MKKFCCNPLCALHKDVEDSVTRVEIRKPGFSPEGYKRVIVKQPGEPDLTMCSTCANVLRIVKLIEDSN